MTLNKATDGGLEKKYPFIKLPLRTSGGLLLKFAESRGGRHNWDVVVGRGEMATARQRNFWPLPDPGKQDDR
jgi:hypothetical protein